MPATSGPISLFFGPEQRYANNLRPPKSLIRAGGNKTETRRSTAQRSKAEGEDPGRISSETGALSRSVAAERKGRYRYQRSVAAER